MLSTTDIGQIEIPEKVRKAADALGLLSNFALTKKLQIEQESDEIVLETKILTTNKGQIYSKNIFSSFIILFTLIFQLPYKSCCYS